MSTQKSNRVKREIKEAFKSLSLIKPIESITVTEIAERAGIFRTTFYHHYEDIFKL
jgi:AcrR family transcriptional regulator